MSFDLPPWWRFLPDRVIFGSSKFLAFNVDAMQRARHCMCSLASCQYRGKNSLEYTAIFRVFPSMMKLLVTRICRRSLNCTLSRCISDRAVAVYEMRSPEESALFFGCSCWYPSHLAPDWWTEIGVGPSLKRWGECPAQKNH